MDLTTVRHQLNSEYFYDNPNDFVKDVDLIFKLVLVDCRSLPLLILSGKFFSRLVTSSFLAMMKIFAHNIYVE